MVAGATGLMKKSKTLYSKILNVKEINIAVACPIIAFNLYAFSLITTMQFFGGNILLVE